MVEAIPMTDDDIAWLSTYDKEVRVTAAFHLKRIRKLPG
jgi:hypothetical protein